MGNVKKISLVLSILFYLFLLSFFIQGYENNNYIKINDMNYTINSNIDIKINNIDVSGLNILINGPKTVYKYFGLTKKNFIFVPKENGTYEISVLDKKHVLEKISFNVLNYEHPEQKEILRDGFVKINTDKQLYNLNQPVIITGNFNRQELALIIISKENSYKFLGLPENNLTFYPKFPGVYEVRVINGSNILIKKEFVVVDDITENRQLALNNQISIQNIFNLESLNNSNRIFKIHDSKGQVKFFDTKVLKSIINKKKHLELELSGDIKKIRFENITSDNLRLGIDEDIKIISRIDNKKTLNVYSINPEMLNFSKATVTKTAKGTELYKCAEWSFLTQSCLGGWVKILDIVPGQDYNFAITPNDPGFAETGVSSINTLKPMYHPNETAAIFITVLDRDGFLVEDALINLTIITPDNIEFKYDSLDSFFSLSPGIYQILFNHTAIEGNYSIFVNAVSDNTNASMSSNFIIKEFYEFDIIRDAPFSIDPWKGPFNSSINITPYISSIDYITLIETIPAEFQVIESNKYKIIDIGYKKEIIWDNINSSSIVSYQLIAPQVTPELYELGPAVLKYTIGNINHTFWEARPWYIAADPLVNLTSTACAKMVAQRNDNTYSSSCDDPPKIDEDDDREEVNAVTSNAARWHGIQVITNDAMSDCYQVNSVDVCWDWYTTATVDTCTGTEVSDTGTGGTFFSVNNTCPSSAGFTCTDVTSLGSLSWDCNSWQSNNAVMRIHAKVKDKDTYVYFDALFFRVNYTEASDIPTPLSWAKNESIVYSDMYVKFNATWTDDEGLSDWIFSINNGSGWVNTSFTSFTSNNLSENITYIDESAGTTIYWKFYANDTQNQWNSTPTQSFVVASASDNESPVIQWTNITPISNVTDTIFNITANITDNIGVDSADAQILLSNSSYYNYTMTSSGGDIWQYLYTSTFGGEFSFIVYGSDANGNTNVSQTTGYFNVTAKMSTDKLYYSRGQNVSVTGEGFSQLNNVTIDIIRKSDGTSAAGYPKNILSDNTGDAADSWQIPADLTFLPGNYTITLNDTNSSILNAQKDIIVIFRSSTATLYDKQNTGGVDVLSAVNDTDSNSQNIIMWRRSEERIELQYNNNVPTGYEIDSVIFGFEHYEDQSQTVYIKTLNQTSSSYDVICTISPSSTNRFTYCNLTSYVSSAAEANSLNVWISDDGQSEPGPQDNNNITYVNFTFLDIQYHLGASTIVIINQPGYEGQTYDYEDTTNNKAYHGNKPNTYTTLLTGTEASLGNYTNLEISDNDRYPYVYLSGLNNYMAYHSFSFTVAESILTLNALKFYYEGYTLQTTSNSPDIFKLYAWNFSGGQYDLIYTSSQSSSDISAEITIRGNLSDIINSSTKQAWFLAESSPIQNQGGGENKRSIHTDYAALETLKYPTLTQTEYINVTAIDSDGISYCNYSFRTTTLNGDLTNVTGTNYWNGSTDTTLISDGYYWFDAVCLDTGANSGNNSIYVRVLNSPPAISLIYPFDDSNFSVDDLDLQFNATDDGGGTLTCNITLNGNINNTNPVYANSGELTNYSLSNLSDGVYYWNVTCWSTPSLTNTSLTQMFTVDTTPPEISKDYPASLEFINTTNITFLFTPSDIHDIFNCSIYIDGIYNQTKNSSDITNGSQNNFTVDNLIEGIHNWSLICSDTFYNSNQTTYMDFYVDLTSPSINLSYPNPGDIFGYNLITFNFTPTDNLDPILICNITVDTTVKEVNLSVNNNTIESQNILLINGFHYWNVTCWDSAGNLNTSETRNLTIQGPPLPLLYSPQNYTGGFNSTTGIFIYNATDNTGIDNCSIYIDGIFNQSNSSILLNQLNNFTIYNLIEGNHTWQIACENGPGVGWSETWIYWADFHNPWVVLEGPSSGSEINGSSAELNWTAYDNLDDNLTCDLRVNSDTYSAIASLNNTITSYNVTGLTDGVYFWNVTCYDILGRYNTTNETWNFSINGAPTIQLDFPDIDAFLIEENITFLYTPTDSGGLENCSIYLDGAFEKNRTNLTSGLQYNFTLYNISEGKHEWKIGCYDVEGGYTESARDFTLDLTDPTIIPYQPNGTTHTSSTVRFNFTAYDNLDSDLILACNITIDDGTVNSFNALNGTVTVRFVNGISDGLRFYNISCMDDAGRIGWAVNLNFTVDTAPNVTLISPIDYEGKTNGNITFEFNASDTSGLKNCSLYLNEAFDQYKNDSQLNNSGISNFTKNNLSQGLYSWYVMCYDLDDNQANSTIEHFYVDLDAPVWVNLTYPAYNDQVHTSTINFNFTAYDAVTINLSCDLYIDDVFNTLIDPAESGAPQIVPIGGFAENKYNWSVECFDASLFSTWSQTWNFTVNFTPEITLINPQPESLFNSPNITVYYLPEDNNATMQWCNLYIDGAYENDTYPNANEIASYNITNLTQGFHTWYWRCSDWDGNVVNSTETWNFTIDLTSPSINLTYPQPNANFSNTSVLLNFTAWDNLDDFLVCNVTLDGSIIDSNLITANNSWNSTLAGGLNESAHYWNVTCSDDAGNTNTSQTYRFNTFTPPVISNLEPHNESWKNNSTVIFYYNVSDTTGIFNCSIYLNGSINKTKNNSEIINNAQNNFTVNALNGTYSWYVQCYDNTTFYMNSTSDTNILYVDIYSPFSLINTQNQSWFNTLTPAINFTISDNMDDVLNYTIYANTTKNLNGTINNSDTKVINLNAIIEGIWEILAQGTDEANNSANSTPITIYVDVTPPNITLLNPTNGNISTNTTVFFNFTIDDYFSPTLNCNLTVSDGQTQGYPAAAAGAVLNASLNFTLGGIYYWNVTCIDLAGNSNTSQTWNFTIPLPDLAITSGNISFNNSNAKERGNITLFANIFNLGLGDATNITVQFFRGNPDSGGVQINGNKTIINLTSNQNMTVNVTWTTVIGSRKIYVLIDPPYGSGKINEANETNNKAFRIYTVSSSHKVMGNVSGNLEITNSDYNLLYHWNSGMLTGDNIFAVDYDSSLDFNSFQAVSRDISNNSQFDDFSEIDSALGSENFSDSINITYTDSGSPKKLKNFTVFNSLIENVPVVNSTNNSNFVTGILWDTSDGNTQFNGTQDLIFITEVNKGKQGYNGIVDFELNVPALLRQYQTGDLTRVTFYTEIK